MKKKIIAVVIFLVAFASASVIKIHAAVTDNTTGWLWGNSDDGLGDSSGIGWISLNNVNSEISPTGSVSYGLNFPTNNADGKLWGYAWSENYGYISFNDGSVSGSNDLAGCPVPDPTYGCSAYRFGSSVIGWARFMSIAQEGANAGGWQGWIKLNGTAQDGTPYGVQIGSGNVTVGYGWSNELGAISFNGPVGPPSDWVRYYGQIAPVPQISLSANPMTIDLTTGSLPKNIDLTWNVSNAVTCEKSGGGWSGTISSPTSGVETVQQTIPTVTYVLTCTGVDGSTATQTVAVTTECFNHDCNNQTCSATAVFNVADTSACATQNCTSDASCQAPVPVNAGKWIEVTP